MTGVLFQIMSFFMTLVIGVMGTVTGALSAGKRYEPEDPDSVLLNAVVISDVHTDGNTFRDRNVLLTKIFSGISKSSAPVDALVMSGDNTNAASADEYVNLEAMLNLFNRAGQIVPSMGNHDSGGTSVGTEGEKSFSTASARHREFLRYCGIETDQNYYYTVVNGYYFIVLGTERMYENDAFISRQQIQWLDDTLSLAQESGKPAFVIGHQPLRYTNGATSLGASIGAQSEEVMAAIRKHTDAGLPVLFVSGHLHRDFSAQSFESPSENLYCLNLPSVQYTEGGGRAVTLEVYADRALIRTRDFLKGEWLADVYTIPLA